MSTGSDFVRELASIPRQVMNNHAEARFAEGFSDAAAIAVGLLSETIDGLIGKIRDGGTLTEGEQKLLAGLTDVLRDTEDRLRVYWTDGTSALGELGSES